jgi:hypothetical protein
MEASENDIVSKGDQVMKAVGELKQLTQDLKEVAKESDTDPEEIGHWISTIGKAILAIFK